MLNFKEQFLKTLYKILLKLTNDGAQEMARVVHSDQLYGFGKGAIYEAHHPHGSLPC